MNFCVDTRSKKTKLFLEYILRSLIEQLNLTGCKKPLLVKIEKNYEHEGIAAYADIIDSYVIVLRHADLYTMGSSLSHEMVHIKQLVKGYLRNENGVKYWCGKRVSKKVKYLDQPWELDAFAKQEILFRRAIES